MDTYLTVNEIAEKLRVERHTVIRWITNGKLRAFKPGGGRFWRIRAADFRKFIGTK
jgi:excisionase family DNA binding protein